MLRAHCTPIRILAGFALLWTAGATQAADDFSIDAGHSSVIFSVKHNKVANFYGRFNKLEGKVQFDETNPANSSFAITVQTGSVDTGSTKRDDHLRSGDFFSAKQFPTMTFKSSAVKVVADDKMEVSGKLTFHGVTKPLTVTMMKTGTGTSHRGQYLVGFETTFTIKRSDFGVDHMLGGLGDEVKLIVSLETVKQ